MNTQRSSNTRKFPIDHSYLIKDIYDFISIKALMFLLWSSSDPKPGPGFRRERSLNAYCSEILWIRDGIGLPVIGAKIKCKSTQMWSISSGWDITCKVLLLSAGVEEIIFNLTCEQAHVWVTSGVRRERRASRWVNRSLFTINKCAIANASYSSILMHGSALA